MNSSVQEEGPSTSGHVQNSNEQPHGVGSVGQFLRRITRTGTKEDDDHTPLITTHGMSLWVATVFIVGEMAGSGVLALPKALEGTSWIGVLVIVFCCCNACYCGMHLGKCWLILEERWEEYRGKVRYPYPAIGERAYGKYMRKLVSLCVDITLFGASTVYLLLCAGLVGHLAQSSGIVFCNWILILGAVLCPFTFFGTPADFWGVAVMALATTAGACVLIVTSIATDDRVIPRDTTFYQTPSFESFFLSFGTIIFAFGGASTFPTFQNDMKDKKQFPKAAIFGFIGLALLYLPVAITGYTVYGKTVEDNILDSAPDGKLKQTVQVFLAVHFLTAFLIVFNPLAQELEEMFKVPHAIGWRRCLLRTAVMIFIVFAGETIPHFGKILSLVGGSTVTLMTFVFPPLFYMRLCDQTNPSSQSRLSFSDASLAPAWPKHRIGLGTRVYFYEIIGLGILGGSVATYQAITGIADPAAFTPPCYINSTAAGS